MDNDYKKFSKRRMLEIIHKEGIAFVKTNLGDNYIIRKADIANFNTLESRKTDNKIEMEFFFPQIDEPVLVTVGTNFKKVNPLLKYQIIGRVSFLEKTKLVIRNVKVFDLEEFYKFNENELGNEKKIAKEFEKFYKQYLD